MFTDTSETHDYWPQVDISATHKPDGLPLPTLFSTLTDDCSYLLLSPHTFNTSSLLSHLCSQIDNHESYITEKIETIRRKLPLYTYVCLSHLLRDEGRKSVFPGPRIVLAPYCVLDLYFGFF